jgi:poly-gamma-glutamate capsule biosynthesis protein CapA/YwtB (metallophosphatase superfamily)
LPSTRWLAETMIDAGADAFIGHHPHVPQGMTFHRERPIFFSLGNLVFGPLADRPWTGRGFLARLTFARGRAPRVEACPYQIDGYEPKPAQGDAEREIAERIGTLSGAPKHTRLGTSQANGCFSLTPG